MHNLFNHQDYPDSPTDFGPQPREHALVAASDTNDWTVCVVDDDASVRKATGRLLASDHWKVESFSDPVEFLRFAQSHHPKVVVLDVRMPAMNGLEVQSRLRKVSPTTRVVILTAKDDPSVRSQAMDAGATAFFLKPVHDEEFLAGIESAAFQD